MTNRKEFLQKTLLSGAALCFGGWSAAASVRACAMPEPRGAHLAATQPVSGGRIYVVHPGGHDRNNGTEAQPLRTISEGSRRARAGDVIRVHGGEYRESIHPPRGGASHEQRIVYEAVPGERVVIKGSERVQGWQREAADTWKVRLSNRLFGSFNPYADAIRGDWFHPHGRTHHTGAVYANGNWLPEAASLQELLDSGAGQPRWFASVDRTHTTIWAQFPGVDPNRELVEINVRQTVFYPRLPGRNYITVRGFTMMHAATPWAPPTAEQIGLVGTHWSRGWIIEYNDISHSACTGVTLGKHGDAFDNMSEDQAEGYVLTIERAFDYGWHADHVGGHVVRNNRISHCEQAGLVGSLGAVFSRITDNEIHDIHVFRQFGGHEQAGIKIHAPVDSLIARNHIWRCSRGIWLDWMTQGTRVTGNVLHDNGPMEDCFIEVNHGPYVIDHNIMLSERALDDWSQGGAYIHNLIAGRVRHLPVLDRQTPWLKAHDTAVGGLSDHPGGDQRFLNNVFSGEQCDMSTYDEAPEPLHFAGNVYVNGARPSRRDTSANHQPQLQPEFSLERGANGLGVSFNASQALEQTATLAVNSIAPGTTRTSGQPFLNYDRTPLRFDSDIAGNARVAESPFPGPIEPPRRGPVRVALPRRPAGAVARTREG